MRALILAAGRGTRMGTLTESCPKGLLPLWGKPLIEYQLATFQKAGIHKVGLVTGYRASSFQGYGTHHFHNPRWATTNMVASLFCARDWLQEETCLVSYADIFYNAHLIADMAASEACVSVAYDPNWISLWRQRFGDPLQDAETFRLSPEGFVQEVGKKPRTLEEIQGQYMGLILFKKEFWSRSPSISNGGMFMTDFLQEILQTTPIRGVPNPYPWGEVDTPSDLLFYEQTLSPPIL
jgi:choline kinase